MIVPLANRYSWDKILHHDFESSKVGQMLKSIQSLALTRNHKEINHMNAKMDEVEAYKRVRKTLLYHW